MTAGLWIVRRRASERNAEHAVLAVTSLLFAASTTLTIVWCASMSAMGGMPMPGGWTMSMAWMRMPEQTWAGAAASSLGMWVVMMVAMMLPSLVPMLLRYREAVTRAAETRLGLLTALVGMATSACGRWSEWSRFHSASRWQRPRCSTPRCRAPYRPRSASSSSSLAHVSSLRGRRITLPAAGSRPPSLVGRARATRRTLPADAGTAWRHGMRLGLHCSCCSAGLTAILLVMGVMDLRVMAVVTTAITAERLAPAGERVARAIGAIAVGAGLLLLARAAGLQ